MKYKKGKKLKRKIRKKTGITKANSIRKRIKQGKSGKFTYGKKKRK